MLSPKNTNTGPFSQGELKAQLGMKEVVTRDIQECANICSANNPKCNTWTFYPNYADSATGVKRGVCLLGNVRQPEYMTLTPHDNGAISGFALNSLSTENRRFLFG